LIPTFELPNGTRLQDEIRAEAWSGFVLCALQPVEKGMVSSDFFITLSEASSSRYEHLREHHVVIGRVAEDSENALRRLSDAFVDEQNRPLLDIRLRKTVVLVYPPGFRRPTLSEIEACRGKVSDPNLDVPPVEWDQIEERPSIFSDIKTTAEQDPSRQARLLAENRAVKLEILGQLSSADAKPKENVLFVCKLNPVTTSKNLNLIFSRFGEIVECEVKRDSKTKESLGYAFIEFKEKANCEEAYRKMQDVVVDGRRIRVDFSQSEGKKSSNVYLDIA